MRISLNGKSVETGSRTLMELVLEMGLDPDSLVAEVNLNVIRQQEWRSLALKDQDTVELLSFVGGG